MLGTKRGTDKEVLRSETIAKISATWFSEDHFSFCDAESAVARYSGEALSPQANDTDAPDTVPHKYVDVNGETNWNLANLNAAHELLQETVLNTADTELQAACRRASVAFPTSIIEVVYFSVGRVSVPVAREVLYDDCFRLTTEVSEVQVKYDCLAVQLSSVASGCGT